MIEKEEEDYICINGWGCGLENISLEDARNELENLGGLVKTNQEKIIKIYLKHIINYQVQIM